MADTIARDSATEAKPANSNADFLPEAYGAPVAAGPEIESFDARSERLEGGRYRRIVPTARQADAGMEMPDVVVSTRPRPWATRPPRKERMAAYLRTINPFTIPGPKVPLLVFGLSTVFTGWDDAALGLIGPELRAEFGLSVQTLVNFGVITGAIGLLGGIPAGYLVDRVKRVRLVRIGAIGSNVLSMLQALAVGQTMYFGVQLLGLVTGTISGPATFPLVADYYPSRVRVRIGAFLGVAAQVTRLVTLPVVGYLIVSFGWRTAVFALAMMGLIVSFATFLLREPVRGGMDRLEFGLSREAAAVEQEAPTWQEALRAAWAVRTLRRQAYVGVVMALTTPVTVVIGLIQAEKFFLDASQRAQLATVQGLLSIPVLLLGGALADKLLSYRPATLVLLQAGIFFVSAATTILNGLVPNLYMFIAFSLILGAASSTIAPAAGAIGSLVVPARLRGIGLQVFIPFQLVGMMLSSPLTRLGERFSLQTSLLLFAPFYAVAGAIVLSTAASIERDIRAARAAAVAREEATQAKLAGKEKILVVRDLDVAYDGVQIVSQLDLDVAAGECLALLGTNGAGKSTVLRAIAGLQEADNGAIFFGGVDVTHAPTHENARAGMVMVPGGAGVFAAMSVRDNLMTAAWLRREDGASVEAGFEHVLTLFPALRARLDIPAGAMSGGEQQMLALAQAFLMQPRLLMIDELSLGLAPSVIDDLLTVVRDLVANGTTVILVEQSLNVALTIAERAVFMDKGRIEFDGPTEDLLRRPDLVRSIFMGGAGGGAAPMVRKRRAPIEESVPVLEASSLSVSFGGVQALDDVSLCVHPGEVVGIIGPNGAGKTTLFDVLSGYHSPDHGRVTLDGDDISSLSPDARARLGLGRAFQNARLFPPLTVRENIAIAFERRAMKSPLLAAVWAPPVRRSERQIAARVDGFIEILGLEAHADKFVRELSTGTRRAVEVACQMAAEPKMLLLDEPSSGLAQAESEALGPALTRVVREIGCGLLVIEHDLPLITMLSDRLLAMELGAVIAEGSPEEVTADARVLESYLAASDAVLERSGSRVGKVLSVLQAPEKGSTNGRGG